MNCQVNREKERERDTHTHTHKLYAKTKVSNFSNQIEKK